MIPMFYDSASLLRRAYESSAAALRWNDRDMVLKIIVPGSAPYIFDNVRVCIGWAWTYLVVAELLGARYGLGYAVIRAQRYLATEKIFAYVIVIGMIGLVTDRLMSWTRARFFPWT